MILRTVFDVEDYVWKHYQAHVFVVENAPEYGHVTLAVCKQPWMKDEILQAIQASVQNEVCGFVSTVHATWIAIDKLLSTIPKMQTIETPKNMRHSEKNLTAAEIKLLDEYFPHDGVGRCISTKGLLKILKKIEPTWNDEPNTSQGTN